MSRSWLHLGESTLRFEDAKTIVLVLICAGCARYGAGSIHVCGILRRERVALLLTG